MEGTPKRSRGGGAVLENRAIPFISFVNGEYMVCPEAVSFLSSLPPHELLAVVSVAGKHRTGKSFFLNHVLLEQKDGGFGVGDTIQAHTKGLWLYPKLVPCTDVQGRAAKALVIDTEGIGALDADATHDTRIFSLALLLSSYFVYNSRGSIDEDALTNLNLVVNVSKSVHVRAGDAGEAQDLSAYFPNFLWLVRDFSLQLKDADGRDITDAAYLESALKEAGDAEAPKNVVRRALKHVFRTRDCFTMVRPVDSESALQALQSQAAQLRPEFQKQAVALRDKILYNVPLKTACGRPVSGSTLAQMASAFVAAINSGAAPVIKDVLFLVSESNCREALDAALRTFPKQQAHHAQAQAPTALRQRLEEAKVLVLAEYRRRAFGDATEKLALELSSHVDSLIELHLEANARMVQADVGKALQAFEKRLPDLKRWVLVREAAQTARDAFAHKVSQDAGALHAWDVAQAAGVWGWAARYQDALQAKLEAAVEERDGARAEKEAAAAQLALLREQREQQGVALVAERAELNARLAEKDGLLAEKRAEVEQLRADLRAEADASLSLDGEAGVKLAEAEAKLRQAQAAAQRLSDELAEERAGAVDAEDQARRDAEDVRNEALRTVEEVQAAAEADAQAAQRRLEEVSQAAALNAARAEARYAALAEELATVRAELKACQADAQRASTEWRRESAGMLEAHATARLEYAERAAALEGKLAVFSAAAAEAATARTASLELTSSVAAAEKTARAAATETSRLTSALARSEEQRLEAERRLEDARTNAVALERRCKQAERERDAKDLDMTRLKLAHTRELSRRSGGGALSSAPDV